MPYVYSTITNDTSYCHYEKGGADLPVLKRKVTIKGGATRGGKHIITPDGVVMHVSDDELEFLESNEAFKRHKTRGHIKVGKSQRDANEVARDMETHDASSPKMVKQKASDDNAAEIKQKASAKSK